MPSIYISAVASHAPGSYSFFDESMDTAGHLHPGCAVSQRGRRVSGKCFIADDRRLIMPAFGAYTGALSVFAEPYERLFKRDETKAWMIGQERLYKFPFERLC